MKKAVNMGCQFNPGEAEPALAMAARREVACSLTRGRHEIGLSLFDVLPEQLPTMPQVKDLIDGIAARLR